MYSNHTSRQLVESHGHIAHFSTNDLLKSYRYRFLRSVLVKRSRTYRHANYAIDQSQLLALHQVTWFIFWNQGVVNSNTRFISAFGSPTDRPPMEYPGKSILIKSWALCLRKSSKPPLNDPKQALTIWIGMGFQATPPNETSVPPIFDVVIAHQMADTHQNSS